MKRFLFVLALVLFPVVAHAQDTIGWHVVKSGDTLEGITARYLGSSASWRENWKLNPDIKDPNKLTPGQRIRVILARELPARFALVEKLSHHVERKPEPDPWIVARPGDKLAQRHGIQTFEASSAQLHFDDDTTLTLTESSMVFLREMKAVQPARDKSDIEIVGGSADVERPVKTKRSSDLQITIGTSTTRPKAGASGSKARVRAEENVAKVMAYRGGAAVESAGASVDVPQGMGVSVKPGEKPPAPERLLPAPSVANIDTRNARPQLQWSAVPGAKSYTIELCRDPRCGELVLRATDIVATSWSPASPLADGELMWRVTARSASGLDGYAATAAKLVIRLGIAGSVRIGERPAANASVAVYRDNGDGVPGAGDEPVGTTTTASNGTFGFSKLQDGLHWVVVDSRSLATNAWADETRGPVGSLCNGLTLPTPGPCAGGRSANSDDARNLATAEHVAGIQPAAGIAADFAFSFDAVTTIEDSGQGSLRQFITNANALGGAHAMQFMPGAAPNAEWWTIAPKTPLPAITNAQTTIEGVLGRGTLGSGANVGAAATPLENPTRPRLALDFSASGTGLDVQAPATIRSIALVNGSVQVNANADTTIENCVIGLWPDGTIPMKGSQRNGVVARAGTLTLRRVLFAQLPASAIDAARVIAEHIEVRSCAFGGNVAAVVIRASGSSIRHALFNDNGGDAGRALDVLATGNAIAQSTFRQNNGPPIAAGEGNVIE